MQTVEANDEAMHAMLTDANPTNRCAARLYVTGVPNDLARWVSAEMRRTDVDSGDVASAILTYASAQLAVLMQRYMRPEGHAEAARLAGKGLESMLVTQAADPNLLRPAAVHVEEPPKPADDEPSVRDVLVADTGDAGAMAKVIDGLISKGKSDAACAARLLATGAHERVNAWQRDEAKRGTSIPDTFAAVLSLATGPLGVVLGSLPEGLRRPTEDLLVDSFRKGLRVVAAKAAEMAAKRHGA